jgi:hypothetical protein
MVSRGESTLLNHATGKKTVDYTGRMTGSVVVKGLIDDWKIKDLLEDEVWVLYCTKYNCSRVIRAKQLRHLLCCTSASGKNWESRHDHLIGTVYPGTALTILGHSLMGKSNGRNERFFQCHCSMSGATRWILANDVITGKTTTLKIGARMRPKGLLIDQDLDDFIGTKNVYAAMPVQLTDGRLLTYYRVTIDGDPELIHRVAWFVRSGVWPDTLKTIHHINHNTLDNRICNLELLDRKGVRNNGQSVHKRVTQNGVPVSSQYKGVHWDKSRKLWVASCKFRQKNIYIGGYELETEARDAYDQCVDELNKKHGCIFTLNRELHLLHS